MTMHGKHEHCSPSQSGGGGGQNKNVLLLLSFLSVGLVVSDWPDLDELKRIGEMGFAEGKLQLIACKMGILLTSLYAFVSVILSFFTADPVRQKTLVFEAACSGDVEALRRLQAAGTDLEEKSCDGRTPLHVASAEGRIDAINYLIEEGVGVNVLDRWGNTPLQDAAFSGHKAAEQLLKKAGAMMLSQPASSAKDLRLRACDAAANGDLEALMVIVSHLASANASNHDGRSLLHLAAAEGHADMVLALLDANADLHCRDRWGGTPLRDAIRAGHQSVIDVLVGKGADIDTVPDEGALKMCTMASRGDVEGIRYLSFNGVSVDSQDYNQRSALHLASADGHKEAVSLLLELGADIKMVDRWGSTAVDDAIAGEHPDVVELLTAVGAHSTRSPEATDLAMKLCDAASRGNVELVEALIKKVGVNAADYDKRSALHLAAAEGQIEVVEMLLEAKANPRVKDRWGFTPLKDALRGGHQHVVEVLLHAADDSSSKALIRTRSIVDMYFAAELDAVMRKRKKHGSGSYRGSLESEDHIAVLLQKGEHGTSTPRSGSLGGKVADVKSSSRSHLRQNSTHDALEGMRRRILQGGVVTESFKMKKGLMFTDAAHLVSKT